MAQKACAAGSSFVYMGVFWTVNGRDVDVGGWVRIWEWRVAAAPDFVLELCVERKSVLYQHEKVRFWLCTVERECV